MEQRQQGEHNGSAAVATWALVGLAEPAATGRLAHALHNFDLACVPTFDTHRLLTHLESPPEFAAVVIDSRLPPAPAAPDTLPKLVAAVRNRTDAAILTLGAQTPDGPDEADADLPPDTPTEAIAAAASALASARRRRSSATHDAPLRLDAATHEVCIGQTRLQLTAQQFRLLETLVAAGGANVSHSRLGTAIYGQAQPGDDQRVRAHIARLRSRLQRVSPGAAEIVATGRGLGYRLIPPGQPGP